MQVLLVCGKGGVGKTAVTAALALHHAHSGGSLAITLNSSGIFADHFDVAFIDCKPRLVTPTVYAAAFEKQEILDSYISGNFKIPFVRNWILKHPLYPHLTSITPGLREVLILDHIFSFATTKYLDQWKTVVVDMPATGHGINLLNITGVAANAVKYGPLKRRLLRNRGKLRDPEFCRAIIVTLPEETPARESKELALILQNKASIAIDSLIVNKIDYHPLSPQSVLHFEALTNNEISVITENSEIFDVSLDPDSVRQAVRLQVLRAKQASRVIRNLGEWWQEPLVLIQQFTEDNPLQISRSIASVLKEGGYHG
ncbi:hypothetical protein K8T06_17560 [bacterium]|nr:hypothetical protein [bacterium]